MKLIYLDGGIAIGYQIAGLIDNALFAKSEQLLRLGYAYRLFPLETSSTCLIGLSFDGDKSLVALETYAHRALRHRAKVALREAHLLRGKGFVSIVFYFEFSFYLLWHFFNIN